MNVYAVSWPAAIACGLVAAIVAVEWFAPEQRWVKLLVGGVAIGWIWGGRKL